MRIAELVLVPSRLYALRAVDTAGDVTAPIFRLVVVVLMTDL